MTFILKSSIICVGKFAVENQDTLVNRRLHCDSKDSKLFIIKPNGEYEKIADLKTYQGWGRKYIEFFYPEEIHIPKGMKGHFLNLLPGVPERCLIDDYE